MYKKYMSHTIFNTQYDTKNKTKNNIKIKIDLKGYCKWKKLELEVQRSGKV